MWQSSMVAFSDPHSLTFLRGKRALKKGNLSTTLIQPYLTLSDLHAVDLIPSPEP